MKIFHMRELSGWDDSLMVSGHLWWFIDVLLDGGVFAHGFGFELVEFALGFELLVEFEFLDDELDGIEDVFAEFFELIVVVGLFEGVVDFVFLDSSVNDVFDSLFFHL